MNLRFQADLEPSIDFVSAQEAALDGLSDSELLNRTAAEGRVLVSHGRRTMLNHFRNHMASGKSSPGLLIVAQGTAIGAAAEAIVTLWAVARPDELTNRAYHLPSLRYHNFPR